MATKLIAMVKGTGVKPKDGEDRQTYLERLVRAVIAADTSLWEGLPDGDQDWVNDAVEAIKVKSPIVDPDGDEEEAPKKKAKKAKAAPVADEEDEEEEAPKKKSKKAKAAVEEEDDEEEEEEDEEEEAPKKKSKKAKVVEEEDDEEEDDDDEEEAPKKKSKKPAVEEEDDEEEDDEEEAPKKKSKKSKGGTPFAKKAPGEGIVECLREGYITAFLKDPEADHKKLLAKTLAGLEKKGLVPGKGTVQVQIGGLRAALASLKARDALKV